MRIFPLVSVTIALLGATACSYERTSAYTSDAQIASAPIVVNPDVTIVRARDGDSTMLNSDNQSIIARTGLNSSPSNPNGTARPSAVMNPYGG